MKFSPIANALKLIGGKWKIMILDNLLFKQMRFGELKRSLNGITSQMLSKKLKEMENDKLLIKKILKSEVLNTQYSLSEFGKSTIPVVKSLIKWGSFNKRKISKITDNDQERVIDLFHDEIRLKNLQRKKKI
ncbi:MAG: helix-turn-helix transcriptional regulator [Flavobacteriaceae bacterium]|nr:helix-turn-helix transcriptional regulator [Flavobacteriaceae bacterium]